MNKTSRWAAIIGVVCSAELVAVAVLGGAGVAALVSLEAALVLSLFGVATIAAVAHRRPNPGAMDQGDPRARSFLLRRTTGTSREPPC